MPSDAEVIEAMGTERLEGKSDAVVAHVASRHALITLRLAIAAERIADALEKAGPPKNVRWFSQVPLPPRDNRPPWPRDCRPPWRMG